MKSSRTYAAIAAMLTLTSVFTAPSQAEVVSTEEARAVADNYVELIINKKGDWGGAPDAQVIAMEKFVRGDRLLGYVFHVKPRGFILTSLHKELSPVKAYSAMSDMDPNIDVGLVDLIKGHMERTIESVDKLFAKPVESATLDDWEAVINTDYRPAWSELADKNFDPTTYRQTLGSTSVGMNYQEGEILVTSNWHQQPPYNDLCPDMDCDEWAGEPYFGYNDNARVGCVAVAGVQILRHWNWPSCAANGEYVRRFEWSSMPDEVTIYSPLYEIDVVAAANVAVADAVGMNFGCDGSSADTEDMEQVFENRRYHFTCNRADRDAHSASAWFDRIRNQLNVNRPVQYRVEGHSIVGDGWQEIDIADVLTRQYHMNYGWGNTRNAWYTLDDLYLGGIGEEFILRDIYPENAMGDDLFGIFSPLPDPGVHYDKPVRYFDVDTSGALSFFEPGQSFQYLRPGFHLTHREGSDPSYITFTGETDAVSEFYLGAPYGDTKIRIADGAINFINGGEMCLH